jgi:hypothetical protein
MRPPVAEIVAVLLTGGLFLVFENVLHLKLHFLIPCTLAWSAYLAVRVAKDRTLLSRWGIRLDNLRSAAPPVAAFFAVAVAALVAWRLARGGQPLPASAVAVFAIYPVWAFIQQFVVQALVASNLERLGLGRALVVPVAAALFGLAHLPDWPLVALCAGAGVAWTILFLRFRNLLVLALSHAWLGALAYYWVLDRNPWLEMFPRG